MEQGSQPCHFSDRFTRHRVYKLFFHTLSVTYWQTHLDNELETIFMSLEHLLLSLRIYTENGHVSALLLPIPLECHSHCVLKIILPYTADEGFTHSL